MSAEILHVLLILRNQVKLYHWQTMSFGRHKATDDLVTSLDANIDKFNQIIHKFSAESQFIIVTHNKRTMASTDIIYGITMIEAGVSRVVPVDLRELD